MKPSIVSTTRQTPKLSSLNKCLTRSSWNNGSLLQTSSIPLLSDMTRHSKNSCSGAFFTSYEKSSLKGLYGTQVARTSGDSLRRPLTCHICLYDPVNTGKNKNDFVDMMVCSEGHVACKECWIKSLLKQKRLTKEAKTKAAETKQKHEQLMKEKERCLALAKFEKKCLSNEVKIVSGDSIKAKERDFLIDLPEIIEKSKCMADNPPHPVTMKSLSSISASNICTVCSSDFGNVIVALLPCGHLTCEDCYAHVKDSKCSKCDAEAVCGRKLVGEGTGFAGGGGKTVITRYQPAFY